MADKNMIFNKVKNLKTYNNKLKNLKTYKSLNNIILMFTLPNTYPSNSSSKEGVF